MAKETNIAWADSTWSPFIGCSKVSPACDNCYAEGWAKRAGRDFSKVVRASTETFHSPLRWNKPARIFVCSLSDFFHPDILRIDRQDAIHVMRHAPQHTYLLLTKRPENVKQMLHGTAWGGGLPNNVWLGVTVENQEQADKRIPILLAAQASTRFISCEPLLGPVELMGKTCMDVPLIGGINWIIAGGESGAKARPMHPDWARSLRDQSCAAGVPFMFKQHGEWFPVTRNQESCEAHWSDPKWHTWPEPAPNLDGESVVSLRVGKIASGRTLDGKLHDAVLVNKPSLNGVMRSTAVCQEEK